MATVQPVQSLNIDGITLQVADLSQQVQALVSVYNEWNQKLSDAQGQFALVQAALNDLSRQIIVQVKKDSDAAAAAANDAAAVSTDVTLDATATDAPAAVSTDATPDASVSTDASPVDAQTAKE